VTFVHTIHSSYTPKPPIFRVFRARGADALIRHSALGHTGQAATFRARDHLIIGDEELSTSSCDLQPKHRRTSFRTLGAAMTHLTGSAIFAKTRVSTEVHATTRRYGLHGSEKVGAVGDHAPWQE
jgi:hypothetical protein